MHTLIALLAGVLILVQAIAADTPDTKPGAAVGAPKIESIKPPLKAPVIEAAKAAASAPKEAAPASKEAAASKETATPKDAAVAKEAAATKEAALQKEVAAKLAARMAALRKEPALRASRLRPQGLATKRRAAHDTAVSGVRPGYWAYDGEAGPIRWGKLNPEWAKCETGSRQSPIDIRDGLKLDLDPVNFAYRPVRVNVLDNGHTIQVNPGAGNRISVMGRTFELVQFHFHRPSEERINGRGFPMVAHLVHKDADGKLAVVAVLIDEGTSNPLVQTVWNNLPLEKNEPAAAPIAIDLNELLPERREYYTYMGSLSTPPCSEGVLWIVLKEPIQLSSQQIAIFSRLYPMNARPIQISSGRLIKESN